MKPEPLSTGIVCTVCGLDWEKHTSTRMASSKKAVGLEDCVRLLKAEKLALQAQARFVGTGTSISPIMWGNTTTPSPNIASGIPLQGNTVGKVS